MSRNQASILMAAAHILVARQHLGESSDIFPGKTGHTAAWRAQTLDECAQLAIGLHDAVERALEPLKEVEQ